MVTGSLEEPTVSSTSEKVPGMDLEAVSWAVFSWGYPWLYVKDGLSWELKGSQWYLEDHPS